MDLWNLNLGLTLFGGVILISLFRGKILSKLFSFQTISTTHAKELLKSDQTLVIDVRTPEEYRASHLPGSISIPLSIFNLRLEQILEQYNNKSVLLICQTGARSMMAAIKLGRAGHQKTYNIKGGLLSW